MTIDPTTGLDIPAGTGASGAAAVADPGTTVPTTSKTASTTPTADNVNALTASDSPYMQQAKSAGLDTANQRGLLNSSIAAGASQKAAYDAAVPIASNDANIASSQAMQGSQIASTEKIANLSAATQTNIANLNIDASAKQQVASILAQQSIASQQVKSQQDIATLQSNTQQSIAALNISDADKQQLLSIAAQQHIADTQQGTQLQIANMNVSSDQQDKAAAAAVSYANVYGTMVNAINSNTTIPADARASYLANAKTLYDNGMSLVEQTYNVQLDWGQNTPAAAPPPTVPTGNPNNSGPFTGNNAENAA